MLLMNSSARTPLIASQGNNRWGECTHFLQQNIYFNGKRVQTKICEINENYEMENNVSENLFATMSATAGRTIAPTRWNVSLTLMEIMKIDQRR